MFWFHAKYESHWVRVEGRTHYKKGPWPLGSWAQTIFLTPEAIEISTPWEIIVTFPPPRTLSELHSASSHLPYFAFGLRDFLLSCVALVQLSLVLGCIASLPPPLLFRLA